MYNIRILVLKTVLRLLLPFSCIIIIIIILIFIMLIILILITILVAWLQGLTSGPSTSTGAEWPSIADRGTKPRGRTAGRSLATRVEASRGGVEKEPKKVRAEMAADDNSLLKMIVLYYRLHTSHCSLWWFSKAIFMAKHGFQ